MNGFESFLHHKWIEEYKQMGAYFAHDGNPKRPHPLLTSGLHSSGFFDSRTVVADDEKLMLAAGNLLMRFIPSYPSILTSIRVVVGPQTGATKLADRLSKRISFLTELPCLSLSPAKQVIDGQKSMAFTFSEMDELSGKTILLCEDVISTGGSVTLTEEAVLQAGGKVLPFVLTLVNRSRLSAVNGKEIIPLVDQPMPMWSPEECPLCQQGSVALRPKEGNNWTRLNASY